MEMGTGFQWLIYHYGTEGGCFGRGLPLEHGRLFEEMRNISFCNKREDRVLCNMGMPKYIYVFTNRLFQTKIKLFQCANLFPLRNEYGYFS